MITPNTSGQPEQPLNTARVLYGTREQFDAMDSSQLMHQVKKHFELRKNKEWWAANPNFQRALEVCREVLLTRGIAVAIDTEA